MVIYPIFRTGQLSREEALRELKKPTYSTDQQAADRAYVIKKLGMAEADFKEIENFKNKTFLNIKILFC